MDQRFAPLNPQVGVCQPTVYMIGQIKILILSIHLYTRAVCWDTSSEGNSCLGEIKWMKQPTPPHHGDPPTLLIGTSYGCTCDSLIVSWKLALTRF